MTDGAGPDGLVLVNPSWRAIRVLLVIGGVCLVVAAVTGGLIASGGPFAVSANTGVSAACLVLLALSGPGAFGMFLSALVTVWPARSTDRVLEQFRRGEFLADWRFPADEWEAFLARERTRLGKTGQVLAWVFTGTACLVSGIVAWQLASGVVELVEYLALVALGSVLFGGAVVWLASLLGRRRIAGLRRNPRVLIGPGVIYRGGTLVIWNLKMLVLQRVQVVSASPMELEVVTGVGTALQAAGAALALAGTAGGAMSSAQTVTFVPVPLGREDEAARVIATLLGASAVPQVQARNAGQASSASFAGAPGALPETVGVSRQPRRPWRWWMSSAALFVLGLAVILAVQPVGRTAGASAWSSASTWAGLVGFSMWAGGFVAAWVALMASISSFRRSRRRAGRGRG